ncbi:transglycosylase SLT domain-containing protein [Streptomyces argyrophylli]|nr:transglycosylase SLT domain-containing protein [Streptomyces argyrophyllae]
MAKAGDIKVGSAWISINPQLDHAQLKAELDLAQKEIAAFTGKQETLARQVAKLQAKLQEYVTAVYGKEAAARVELEKAAAAKRKQFNQTEVAAYLKAITAVTTAEAKQQAARTAAAEKAASARDKVSRTARDLEIKHGRDVANAFLGTVAQMEAAGKTLTAGRIASAKQWATLEIAETRKVAAEKAALSRLVIRQATMEAAEQTKAARTAQTAYTQAYNSRKAQLLSEMEMQRATSLAATKAALAQKEAAKASARETIRQNNATVRTLQSNATKVEKSWTKAVHSVGSKLTSFGSSMSEFGRTVQHNIVTPLLSAASAMSYLGITAADSIIQAQTALLRIDVSPKDTAAQLKELKEYGVQTPYKVEDEFKYAAQYTRAGRAHGLSGGKASRRATQLVESIGNLAAYAGITDPEQVSRALYAVGTLQDADRASLRHINSLAINAGIPVEELAKTFGFKDRAFTAKERKDKLALQKKKGISIPLPKMYTASAQLQDWSANAKETGGVPGEGIVTALLKRGKDPKVAGAAKALGSATISAKLANTFEQAKYGLSSIFISPTGKDGTYKYTGAGKALIGKGGLIDTLGQLGTALKPTAAKAITELFDDLTWLSGKVKSLVQTIKDHPAIADAVVQIGKWGAILAGGALVLGTFFKTLGLLTKILSPLAGPAKLLVKGIKGGAKIASQATGLGSKTDAEREAKSIRERAKADAKAEAKRRKQDAKRARKDAKNLSDPRDRARERLHADYIEKEAKRQAKEDRKAGRQAAKEARRTGNASTSYAERYRQRRTGLNDGDDRNVGRRAIDRVRGNNSQVDKVQVDTTEAEKRIQQLDREIADLRLHIQNLKTENLKQLADSFAGQDSSVKAKAEAAAQAVRDSETAVKNLRQLQLQALEEEFKKVTSRDNKFKSSVDHSETAVKSLNDRNLNHVSDEFKDVKEKSNSLTSAAKGTIKQVNKLNSQALNALGDEFDNLKGKVEDTTKKVGSSKTSLIGRIGQLNSMDTDAIVRQIENLKDKLSETAGEALTLNNRLDDISKHAPGGDSSDPSKSGKSKKGKSKKRKALGGVLPGYTPGRDVHQFVSPTGGVLELSGGESVMRPEWTAAMGPDYVNRMNVVARQQGVNGVRQAMQFAKGGILSKMGLDKLVEASKNFNVAPDALGAFATMAMDSSSRGLGGGVQKGVVGTGTAGSHFVGSDLSKRLEGMKSFMSRDSWDLLKKLPIPDGYSQAIGLVGGAVGPVAGDYFWDDVWKGHGNILDRGNAFLDDLFSFNTVKRVVGDFFGGAWDTVKSVVSSGTDLLTDPVGAAKDAVLGVWELVKNEYTSVTDMIKTIREIYSSPKDYATQVWGDIYDSAQDSMPNLDGLFDFSGSSLSAKKPNIDKAVDQQLSTPGKGSAVTRWTPQVRTALAQLGLSPSYTDLVLHRIQVESGGNPKAINLTDSNAKAGHPSQGLLQTIPSTFAAYAGPYKSRGITDPMASIYAGLNYAIHRYGSGWVRALSGTKGYATGTMGADNGWAWVGEEGPELVNFRGGETVLNHQDSMLATVKAWKGYAAGTGKRTTGVAADAEKGVSSLNSAVRKLYEIITKAFTSDRIGSKTANSLNKWLDGENKQLQKLVKDRADLAPKLKDANSKLAAIKKDESELAASISDKAKGLRSLADVFNSGGVSVSGGLSSLKQRLAAIKSFQSDISALVKKGFSKDIISEIAQAGPEQGDAMAKELLKSTASQVADYNKTYAAIGSASDSLGKSVAGSYYKAGKAAAQSLVDGLTSKDKSLVKQIEGLADTIVKTLKKKLHFNSKTPVDPGLASLLTWLTGESQAVKGKPAPKKSTRVTTSYSTDSKGRKVVTVTTTVTDPVKGTTTTTTERTVGGKTTKTTKVSKIKGYATGTRSASPGIALVGERGPELVRFGGGERVLNARQTADAMGPRYEIHIHEAKSEDTTQAVLRAMKYAETMAAL